MLSIHGVSLTGFNINHFKINRLQKSLSLGLALLVGGLAQFPARAEILLSGRCHMGECVQVRFDRKTLLQDDNDEQLYAIETALRFTPMGTEATGEFREPQQSYVRCSQTRPAHIFQLSDSDHYIRNDLNPGADPSGFNYEAYMLYWVTCHNIVGPDFFNDAMHDRAIELGYSLNLNTDQVSGDTLEDVLQ